MDPVLATSLATAAAKLILPVVADKLFAFRKTVKSRSMDGTKVANFEFWREVLGAVESYSERTDGSSESRTEAEARKAAREKIDEEYQKAAQKRSQNYETKMNEELEKEKEAKNKASNAESPSIKLNFERIADQHNAFAKGLAHLKIIADSEVNEAFVERDVQMNFGCNREDLACRASIIILQYSLLLVKKQEHESRQFLIRSVATMEDKIIKNRYHSRKFSGHLWRELIIDLISLQAWQTMPGHYLNWFLWRGVCVKTDTYSACLLTLLILRTLRHSALLLEAIRRRDHSSTVKEMLVDDTLAVHRFERSLLWETTCTAAPEPEGRSVAQLDQYEYESELMYPQIKQGDVYVISDEEKLRVKLGCALYDTMVANSVKIVQNVANTTSKSVPRGKKNILRRYQKNELQKTMTDYDDFTVMVTHFEECAKVVRDVEAKQKIHLNRSSKLTVKLAAELLAYRYRREVTFDADAIKLKETTENLKNRLNELTVQREK
jgi:hypothetical protein